MASSTATTRRPGPFRGRRVPTPKTALDRLVRLVQQHLSDDLRRPPWKGSPNRLAGHCFVASEAIFYLLGGKRAGWVPQSMRHEDAPHWFLLHRPTGRALDATGWQFRKAPDPACAVGKGFTSSRKNTPSRRAAVLMARVRSDPAWAGVRRQARAEIAATPRTVAPTGTLAAALALRESGRAAPARRANPGRSLLDRLEEHRAGFASAAQEVYDDWEQDEDGECETHGAGGICDSVAAALATVVQAALPDVGIIDGGQEGDGHAWIVAVTRDEAVVVDIPADVYETGGGYCWRKRPGVTFQPEDVVLEAKPRAWFEGLDEWDRADSDYGPAEGRENPPRRVLYHGTLRSLLPEILREGLVPRVGANVRCAYDVDDRYIPLVFAASTPAETEAAIRTQIAAAYRIPFHKVTRDDVARLGAVVEVPRTAFRQCPVGASGVGEHPPHVEEEDWYAGAPVRVLRVWSDGELDDLARGRVPRSPPGDGS